MKKIKEEIRSIWKTKGEPLLTLGFDGFKTEAGTHVINFTESACDLTAYVECVDPEERRENHELFADLTIKLLEKGAAERNKTVEETYTGVTPDNVIYNMSALEIVLAKYPKLFTEGCRTHCLDLLNEDIFKVPELSSILKDCVVITKYIRSHKYVKVAFTRMIKTGRKMPVLYPITRFGYADKTVERICENKNNLIDMIDETGDTGDVPSWSATSKKINITLTNAFEALINNEDFFRKIAVLRTLTSPLSAMTHHSELACVKTSWLFPLMQAFYLDAIKWKHSVPAVRYFSEETRNAVLEKVMSRWNGNRSINKVSLKTPTSLLAMILDPYTQPLPDELPINWHDQCKEVLTKFYTGTLLDDSMDEVKCLLLRNGKWGEYVVECQQKIVPPEGIVFANNVSKVIWMQKKMRRTTND